MHTLVTGGTLFVLFIAASGWLSAQTGSSKLSDSIPLALASGARVSAAPGGDTLRLADLVGQALRESPRLQAVRLEADAAREHITQPGALPNPELTFGLRNRPLDGFGTDQPMTMNAIGLVQRFPWPGVQGFSQDRAGYLAEAAQYLALEADVQLVARLAVVYYRTAYLDRAIAIMGNTRDLLRGFLEVAGTRYAIATT